MAYGILKHRRGTTQEWLDINLIPESGELVVEECSNGFRKCKIGDGKSTFKELSYTDDETKTVLLSYIDDIYKLLDDKISSNYTKYSNSVKVLKTYLEKSVSDTTDALKSDLLISTDTVLSQAKKYSDNGIIVVKHDFDLALEELLESLESKTLELETSIKQDIDANIKTLNDKITQVKKTVDADILDNVLVLDDKLNKSINDIESSVTTRLEELSTSVSDTKNSLISDIDSQVVELKQELITHINKVSDEHIKDTIAIHSTIEKTTDNLAAKIDTAISENNNTVNTISKSLSADYNKKITDVKEDIQKEITNIVSRQTVEIEAVKTYLEDLLSIANTEHASDISELENSIVQTGLNMYQELDSIKHDSNKNLEELLLKITELQNHGVVLEGTDKAILDELCAVNTNLNSSIKDLQTLIDNLSARYDIDIPAISHFIVNLNDEHKNSIDTFNKLLDGHVNSINKKLSELTENDVYLLHEIAGTNNTLSEDIKTASNALKDTIENLKYNTNLQLIEINKDIQAINLSLDQNREHIKSELTDIRETLQSLKDNINTKASQLASDIFEVNNKIKDNSDKIAFQDKRISNLLALKAGSTTGDAELADIRTGYNGITYDSAGGAVRAIGYELDELKNSLPNFIPENSVDGLEYDTNTNELYLTSKNQKVGESVVIIGGGGSGSSSVSIVKVTNNLSSNILTFAKNKEVWIDFTYTSFEEGIPTGNGTYTITINDKRIEDLSGEVLHDVAKQIEISKYLRNGSNTVLVTCTDSLAVSRKLVYTISIIELSLTSTFNSYEIFNNDITFRFNVSGQVEKTLHIIVDEVETTKNYGANVHNRDDRFVIEKLSHGLHTIVAFLTATINGIEIPSNILKYEIICDDATDPNRSPVIASVFNNTTAIQGDLLSIPYQVYDSMLPEVTIDQIIYSQVGGIRTEISRKQATVGRGLNNWLVRDYPAGNIVFKLVYTYERLGETRTVESTEHMVTVSPLKVDVLPEQDGLQLYLTANGRSNTDTADIRESWTFNNVTTTFNNFNWRSNGWVEDDHKDICLRLTGDARAIINFKPFEEDFKANGKTIEFEFAVRDVNSRNAVVIDCFNEDEEIGFIATPDTAYLQSSGSKSTCRYKENERIRVSVTVEPSEILEVENGVEVRKTGSCFVSIYLDGILTGVQRYDASTDNFNQTTKVPITLGSNLCGLDVYSVRVYDKALTTSQILTNYIADKAIPSERQDLLKNNDILFTRDDAPDESFIGQVSYDKVKKLGKVPIITFTGKMPEFKGDKKKNSVRMKFEDPENPKLNFDVLLEEIDVQGTSSADYVRKNWKVKLNEAKQHLPGAIPAKVFCIKVDYAEATGTHNTGTANYVETLYDRNISIIPPQKDNPLARTTIQGFPVVLFEKATEDSEPVFSSKGNFNYDKGSEAIFGFTNDYKDFGAECWEFCNNISDCVSFLGPIPSDWKDDFEPRYTPIKSFNNPDDTIFDDIEELQEAKKKALNSDGIFTEAQQEALTMYQDLCISNFRELHNWVLSTATYKLESGSRVSIVPKNDREADSLDNKDDYRLSTPITYANTTYIYDTEEYRLAKFKNEFTQYFDLHYSTMYYVFTLFALMVDQRAKNLFLTRWKCDDGVYRWYPYFYDNDTIFGINNVGSLKFDYFHEDTDQIASADVYNGQNSTLWNNFRLCFANEIQELYRTLRSNDKLTYDTIIDWYVNKGSDKWSATIYNADAEYKYITMARPDENGNFDMNNLYQVRGPGEHHLRYFISNRLNYCDSKWYAGNYPSDQIVVRLYTPKITEITDDMTDEQKEAIELSNARILESQQAVPASPDITLTPYSDMYTGINYASGTLQQKRLKAGESWRFSAPEGVNTNDAETSIYGASGLSSLGDLSNLYCDYLDLSKATKLIDLKIGDKDPRYHNDNIASVTLGNNRLLKTLDLRNCSGLGISGANPQKTLTISGCQNIENIYAEGTNYTAIALPVGGYIKTLHLPASINTLTIKDHKHIIDFSIPTYENIRTLHIENCPTIDAKGILETCRKEGNKYSIEYVYLKGFNWFFQDASFIKSLFPVFEGEDENKKLVSGVLGLTDKDEATENPAYLQGNCYIEELTGEEYKDIKDYFPHLNISFGKMISKVTFKYQDKDGIERTETVSVEGLNSSLGNCSIPTFAYEPYWPENDAFRYEELVGWSINKQSYLGVDDYEDHYLAEEFADARNGSSLKNIEGDIILYPVFKATRKQYEVKFINPTAPKADQLVQIVMTPYGGNAIWPEPNPTKLDSASPELYKFIGWSPEPIKITGDMECYAQFAFLDNMWYTINFYDFNEWYDANNIKYNGYTLNSDGTMNITKCINDLAENPAKKVLPSYNINGTDYYVAGLGGFSDHKNLELINIPNTVTKILSRGFYNCQKLSELTLSDYVAVIEGSAFQGCTKLKELLIPKNVRSIGQAAFADCTGLKSITVAEGNTSYKVENDCLISLNDQMLVQALPKENIEIPSTVKLLGEYCFSHMPIKTITIPSGITKISYNAFSSCLNLSEVILPDTITVLEATCFAWCTNLSSIRLPRNLYEIKTYVFNSCPLTDVVIPASVGSILTKAFGDIPSLHTITFEENIVDDELVIPNIHSEAFANSGSTESPVIFNVPWSEAQHKEIFEEGTYWDGSVEKAKDPTFGTKACIFNFNYKGV